MNAQRPGGKLSGKAPPRELVKGVIPPRVRTERAHGWGGGRNGWSLYDNETKALGWGRCGARSSEQASEQASTAPTDDTERHTTWFWAIFTRPLSRTLSRALGRGMVGATKHECTKGGREPRVGWRQIAALMRTTRRGGARITATSRGCKRHAHGRMGK